jgi:hypothetical protein
VVQPVAAEDGVVRDVDVQRVAHEADVVALDARAGRVVQLHAVAPLRGAVVALADDDVVLHPHVVGFLDPQAEQVVDQVVAADHGAVRAGFDVDAGVLRQQAVARVAHDQALDRHVGRLDADGVALHAAAEGGLADAAQGQRFGDHQVALVPSRLHFDHVAGGGPVQRGLDGLAGAHRPRRRLRGAGQGQEQQGEEALHPATGQPSAFKARNSEAPISRFLNAT